MNEEEEFEFRARLEAEQAQQAAAASAPPANPNGPVAPSGEPGLGTKIIGGLDTAAEFAKEFPKTTAATVELGLAALPESIANRIPIVSQASQIAKAPFKIASGALDAANAYSASKNANALAQMEHQARQYIKAGQAIPQGLQQSLDALRSRVGGPIPTGPASPASIPTPAATPNLPPAQTNPLGEMGGVRPGATPPVGGPAAQQGADFINRITKQFAPMAAKVAPVLSGLNRALPAAQVGMGLLYTSPEEIATLKAAEERRRRMGQ